MVLLYGNTGFDIPQPQDRVAQEDDMVNNGVPSRLGGSRNCTADAVLPMMP